MNENKARLAVWAALLMTWTSIHGADWPQWRGPHFNGSSPEKNLPSAFSKTNGLRWSAPLPGPAGATPIIFGDRVFVSSPDEQKNLLLLCFDRADGKELWRKVVGVGDKTKGKANMASPSPVTDGQRVIALFGTGNLAAFDFAGQELWARNLCKEFGAFSIMWIYGSSPLLYQGNLYVLVLQRDPPPADYPLVDRNPKRDSYLLCLDPVTGKDRWRHVRPTDARLESMETYSTPIPHGNELLVVGGNYVTAHRADTGVERWRSGGLNPRQNDWYRIVPTPVVADGAVVACGPKGQPVIAIRDGGRGLVTETHRAWTQTGIASDWSTPLFYQDRLYVLDGGKRVLACLDPKTGKILWSQKLDVSDQIWSSPTGADGKLYLLSEQGTVLVLKAGDQFEALARIEFNEGPSRSSVAVAHGQLLIRTAKALYCVGPQP